MIVVVDGEEPVQLHNKKADATLLSWVLLIGLAISLAALVSNWAINNAKKFNPEDITAVDQYCPDVSININTNNCEITNTGLLDITKLIIIQISGTTEINLFPSLQPQTQPLQLSSLGITCNPETEIIPVTNSSENKFVPCSSKRVII